MTAPEGKCRRCGHALERDPERRLRWHCPNVFCPSKQKEAVTVGSVVVTNRPRPAPPTRAEKVERVAELAAALLAATPVPLDQEQAVALAVALVEKGWRR